MLFEMLFVMATESKGDIYDDMEGGNGGIEV